jgi:surface polysaccharide O-acyltransferase-like enzyme
VLKSPTSINAFSGLIILKEIFQGPLIWIGEYIDQIIIAIAFSPIIIRAQLSPSAASSILMFHRLCTYIAALLLLYTIVYFDKAGQ